MPGFNARTTFDPPALAVQGTPEKRAGCLVHVRGKEGDAGTLLPLQARQLLCQAPASVEMSQPFAAPARRNEQIAAAGAHSPPPRTTACDWNHDTT